MKEKSHQNLMKKSGRFLIMLFMFCVICLTGSSQVYARTVANVTQKAIRSGNESKYYFRFNGYDKNGKKIWTKKSAKIPMTELAPKMGTQKVISKNNLIYYAENGRLVALDKNTGKVKWRTGKNTIGALTSYCFDKTGNIYICGYYSPDLVKINKKGIVCWTVKSVSSGYYWANKVKLSGNKILVTYEAPSKKILTFNVKNGKLIK